MNLVSQNYLQNIKEKRINEYRTRYSEMEAFVQKKEEIFASFFFELICQELTVNFEPFGIRADEAFLNNGLPQGWKVDTNRISTLILDKFPEDYGVTIKYIDGCHNHHKLIGTYPGFWVEQDWFNTEETDE